MITWMQRKKKYLMVILWVTVISFVGAGFVGWGSYSYGNKASNVAKIGDVEVTVGQFQRQYSNIFSYYNELLEGKVSDAQKKDFEKVALQNLINRALLLNYAKELGLSATEQEIGQEIAQTPNFHNSDGKFEKEIYLRALNNAGIKIAEYEAEIKKDITINKLSEIFAFEATELEVAAFATPMTMKDKLEYKVLSTDDITPKVTEELKRQFFEDNKERFMSEPSFNLSFIKVAKKDVKITEALAKEHYEKNKTSYLDGQGNPKSFEDAKSEVLNDLADSITRREALKRSVAWKKGEVQPQKLEGVPMENSVVPADALREADRKASLNISKPVAVDDGYVVFKIDKRVPPRQLTYEESKRFVDPIVQREAAKKELEELAQRQTKDFSGKVTDYVGISDASTLTDLTNEEAQQFMSTLLTTSERVGVVNLGEKAVIYKILEQKLFEDEIEEADSAFARNSVERVKSDTIIEDLIGELKNRYTIETYIETL